MSKHATISQTPAGRSRAPRIPERALVVLVPLGLMLFGLSYHVNATRHRAEVRDIGEELLGLHGDRAAEATHEALAYARTADPFHLEGVEEASRWASVSLQAARDGWGRGDVDAAELLDRVERLWSRHYLETQALVSGVAAGGTTPEAMAAVDGSSQAHAAAVLAAARPATGGGLPWLPGALAASAFLLVAAAWPDAGRHAPKWQGHRSEGHSSPRGADTHDRAA